MRTRRTTALACAAATLACAIATIGSGPAAAVAPGAAAPNFAPGELVVRFEGSPVPVEIDLPPGAPVVASAAAIEAANPRVVYAVPNLIATASAFPRFPRDPGVPPGRAGPPGGWVRPQWNFLPCGSLCAQGTKQLDWQSLGGIDAPAAWRNLIKAGSPGGRGVTVAVLDSGIAYRNLGRRFRRSPDLAAAQFVRGFDFVANDGVPLDHFGHGTHVASTIGERTNNALGVTGLAYGARLMPVRVLDEFGSGEADDIARGIRFAARRGADVINMSFNFSCHPPPRESRPINEALAAANRRGVILVASAGNWAAENPNDSRGCIELPATVPEVISVGGTTMDGCSAAVSRIGTQTGEIDVVAPAGGPAEGECAGNGYRPIVQLTFRGFNPTRFGLPRTYIGTSMSAAHVSGVIALILASDALPASPPPRLAELHLERTARDLGPRGPDPVFGAGLIDAGAATAPQG